MHFVTNFFTEYLLVGLKSGQEAGVVHRLWNHLRDGSASVFVNNTRLLVTALHVVSQLVELYQGVA